MEPFAISTKKGIDPMEEPRNYFVVIYRPSSGWLKGKTIQEQPTAEHTAYMKQLQQTGRLVPAGPFKDSTGPMAIIGFENLEAAIEAVMNDPPVKTHLFSAEVHPWEPAATGRNGYVSNSERIITPNSRSSSAAERITTPT